MDDKDLFFVKGYNEIACVVRIWVFARVLKTASLTFSPLFKVHVFKYPLLISYKTHGKVWDGAIFNVQRRAEWQSCIT